MNLFGKWKDKATQYVDVRVQLMKLKFIERASNVLSSLMLAFVLLVVSIAVLIFLGIGIMESFALLFDSRIGGAFAAAGVFVLFMAILFGVRNSITSAFAGIFIRIMTDPGEEEDEDEANEKNKRKVTAEDDDDDE